jgi:hypothetical protein
MVKDSIGRAVGLLDSAGAGTARTAPSPARRRVQQSGGSEILRVPLCEGAIDVRVPRKAVRASKRPPQQNIEGFNADATPC